jgi:hypothetical protein
MGRTWPWYSGLGVSPGALAAGRPQARAPHFSPMSRVPCGSDGRYEIPHTTSHEHEWHEPRGDRDGMRMRRCHLIPPGAEEMSYVNMSFGIR